MAVSTSLFSRCPKTCERMEMTVKNNSRNGIGVVAGLLGAVCFGFIPVFSKPALALGLSPMCILAYRFSLAAIALGILLKLRRVKLGLAMRDVPGMALLALYYCVSGGCLMMGYEYMSGGVAGVIHFSYPVFVVLIMLLFFRERVRLSSAVAITAAIAGIYCLGALGGDAAFLPGANRLEGVLVVVLSGIGYASYLVGVGKGKARNYDSLYLTFWILVFTAVFFIAAAALKGELVIVSDAATLLNFTGLALVATVVANVLAVYAVKVVGSTLESILSAMEPATSVVMCIILFDEQFTLPIAIGIVLIFIAVGIVVLSSRR